MYLDEAVTLLDDLCSSQDPIFYKGVETTPSELPYLGAFGRDHTILAKDIRVSYYGGAPFRLIHGTLSGMVKDRKGQAAPRMTSSPRSSDAVSKVHTIIDRLHEQASYPKWLMKSLRRLVLDLEK